MIMLWRNCNLNHFKKLSQAQDNHTGSRPLERQAIALKNERRLEYLGTTYGITIRRSPQELRLSTDEGPDT